MAAVLAAFKAGSVCGLRGLAVGGFVRVGSLHLLRNQYFSQKSGVGHVLATGKDLGHYVSPYCPRFFFLELS